MTEFQPAKLLQALYAADVEFVIIGGVAAAALGLARNTYDLDIVYKRSSDNCQALARALESFRPFLRDLPSDLPFKFDAETIQRGTDLKLSSDAGDIDIFAEVPGMESYENLLENSTEVTVFGTEIKCLNLDMLINLKRAAGRPRDIEMVAQLESLKKAGSQ